MRWLFMIALAEAVVILGCLGVAWALFFVPFALGTLFVLHKARKAYNPHSE